VTIRVTFHSSTRQLKKRAKMVKNTNQQKKSKLVIIDSLPEVFDHSHFLVTFFKQTGLAVMSTKTTKFASRVTSHESHTGAVSSVLAPLH